MRIEVNGEARDFDQALSIAELIDTLGLKPELVAVQHNDAIVERDSLAAIELADGDRVELIRIVGGG